MADDIAPDWLRGKQRADPRFQQALRTLPLSAFDKVERIFDPNRGVIRVFGFYDNFTATIERDPEPMVLHPMFEDWHAAQPPETAAAAIPGGGAEADWQTPALAIAGERGIDPQQMRGMTQLEAARYLQSNDPATLAPDIGEWLETQSPEHLAAIERGDPLPADLQPPPLSLLRSLQARAAASEGQIRAKPASVQATRSQLWDTARLFNVDPAPMATMTDADAWGYLDSAQEMPGRFDDTYRDFNRRAFIGQPEPPADPGARAPSSEGGRAAGEAVLGFAPGIGTVIGAKDLVASYRTARAARARGDDKALAEAERMMGLSLIGLLPFLAGITRARRGAKVIVGVTKTNRAGKAAKGPEAMATEGTAVRNVSPALESIRKHFSGQFRPGQFEKFAERFEKRTPLGFSSREEVVQVVESMQNKLKREKFDDVKIVMRGSSVTGHKFKKRFEENTGKYVGPAFDAGRTSDFDFALVSPKLFQDLKIRGVRLVRDGTRTIPVEDGVLKDLGLKNLLPEAYGGIKRGRSIVVFDSLKSLVERGPFIPLD